MDKTEIELTKKWLNDKIQNINQSSVNEMVQLFMSSQGRIAIKNDRQIEMFYKILQSSLMEKEDKRFQLFTEIKTLDELSLYDEVIKNILYRIYSGIVDDELTEMIEIILDNKFSVYTFLVYSGYFNLGGEEVIIRLSDILDEMNYKTQGILLLNAAIKMYKGSKEIVTKLAEKYVAIGMKEESKRLLSNQNMLEV